MIFWIDCEFNEFGGKSWKTEIHIGVANHLRNKAECKRWVIPI
jgi:hypothetical protein